MDEFPNGRSLLDRTGMLGGGDNKEDKYFFGGFVSKSVSSNALGSIRGTRPDSFKIDSPDCLRSYRALRYFLRLFHYAADSYP
jgi:hypothetical protein